MCRLNITQKLGLRREKTITVPKPAKDIRTEKLNYKYIFVFIEIFKKEKINIQTLIFRIILSF